MIAIICGGRKYKFSDKDKQFLDSLASSLPITGVACGMAQGADLEGRDWAKSRLIPVSEHKADWDNIHAKGAVIEHTLGGHPYNALAGLWRNEAMAKIANAVIAFPGGRGTADMIERGKKHGMKIIIPHE